MKSLDRAFSKARGVLGQRPESLVATSETFPSPFQFAQRITGSFLCGYLLKERTETICSKENVLFPAKKAPRYARSFLLIPKYCL
jgi:hypothetical protein